MFSKRMHFFYSYFTRDFISRPQMDGNVLCSTSYWTKGLSEPSANYIYILAQSLVYVATFPCPFIFHNTPIQRVFCPEKSVSGLNCNILNYFVLWLQCYMGTYGKGSNGKWGTQHHVRIWSLPYSIVVIKQYNSECFNLVQNRINLHSS